VDDICDHQQQHGYMEHRARVVLAQYRRQAAVCDHADPAANLLDRTHKRVCPGSHPQLGVAELCTGLAISLDARWVVVGRPGDETRPQNVPCGCGAGTYRHACMMTQAGDGWSGSARRASSRLTLGNQTRLSD
jgi:hypothetical protein